MITKAQKRTNTLGRKGLTNRMLPKSKSSKRKAK